jgi:hypothetical protein
MCAYATLETILSPLCIVEVFLVLRPPGSESPANPPASVPHWSRYLSFFSCVRPPLQLGAPLFDGTPSVGDQMETWGTDNTV